MGEFDIKDNILRKYKGSCTDVVVPDGVERISKGAFSGIKVRSVVLPDSVTHIRPRAFAGCSELTSVRLSAQLTEITKEAFFDCSSLAEIIIPSNVTDIREKAFYACESLVNISLPDGLKRIDRAAFMGCKQLLEIDIPDTVERINENTFRGCISLSRVMLPSSLKCIASSAFADCSKISEIALQSDEFIYISDVSGIEETSWYNDSHDDFVMITDKQLFRYHGTQRVLMIPSYIEYISSKAFDSNDTVEELTVPSTVKYVGSDAFYNCTNLKKVWYAAEESDISIFDECSSLEEVYFADNVRSVGGYCLYNCRSVKYVRLSAGMEKIEISVLPRFSDFDLELPHAKGNMPSITMFNYSGIHRIYAPYLTAEDVAPMGSVVLMCAAMGYIDMCTQGRVLSHEVSKSWQQFIISRSAYILSNMQFSDEAVEYMCSKQLITFQQLEQCMGLARDDITLTARLLEYKHTLGDNSDYSLD